MMILIKPYIKAFCLLVLFPSAFADFVKQKKWMVMADCGFVAVSLLFVLSLSSGKANDDLHIVDLTRGFNTGAVTNKPKVMVAIHHTAGNPDCCINDIAKIHLAEHRWSGIGYHYYIDKDGVVYNLRSENEIVPHSYHFNDNAVAICLAGNFNDYEPTKAQWSSAVRLTKEVLKKYNLSAENVFKHGQLRDNATECCGRLFNIEKFREEL